MNSADNIHQHQRSGSVSCGVSLAFEHITWLLTALSEQPSHDAAAAAAAAFSGAVHLAEVSEACLQRKKTNP